MSFWGVIANSVGVALGGLVGIKFGSKFPQKVGETLMSGLALCILFVGVDGVRLDGDLTITVLCIAVGAVVGEFIDFESKINDFGNKIQEKLSGDEDGEPKGDFGSAFVSTTLLLSVGAMSLVGSLESGMLGDPTTLITKAIIDTVVVTVLASTMGIGVPFAALPLFLFQGGLTLLAGFLAPFMSDMIINQMAYVGSVLIVAVSLNMLNLTKIRVGNLVLAPFLPMFLVFFK